MHTQFLLFPLQAYSQYIFPNHYTVRGKKKFISIKNSLFKALGLFFSRTLAGHLYYGEGMDAWQRATALQWSQEQSSTHTLLEAEFKDKTRSEWKKASYIHSLSNKQTANTGFKNKNKTQKTNIYLND